MIKYEVLVEAPNRSVILPVFTESTEKEVIKSEALILASKHLTALGIDHDMKDLKAIGYKNCGISEVVVNETT